MTDRLARDWDELARTDAMFAILSDGSKNGGRWSADEFFETGRQDFAATMSRAESWSLPMSRKRALDFGCGVGRVTQAVAESFETSVGVDVSAEMVAQARTYAIGNDQCEFIHNVDPDLRAFADAEFDLVYCNVVLQHLGRRRLAKSFIAEFCRVLSPGGLLVFQVPHSLPLRSRFQMRRRLHRLLRAVRVGPDMLASAGMYPISMLSVSETDVDAIVTSAGHDLVQLDVDVSDAPGYPSATHWVTRRVVAT